MSRYREIFVDAFGEYAQYLVRDITESSWRSYFYLLISVSLIVYAAELIAPWRKLQPHVRGDFWLDRFYMFFIFFLFSLLGYDAVSKVVPTAFEDARGAVGINAISIIDLSTLSVGAQLLAMFVLRDFIHYWIHRLLHRVPRLWEFHKVHHQSDT